LQPVINQRRAKPSNEYRPTPHSQQAWSGAHADEARELRAFDRIRDDGPFRPGGKRKPNNNNSNKKKRGGGGKNASQPGARQNAPRHGKSRSAGQVQIGVYQPPARTWFAGEERPQRNSNSQGRGARDGIHQNRHPFANNEGGAQPNKRFKPQRDNRPRGGGNFAGQATQGQRPFRQDEAPPPRDDIGNRIQPEGRRGGRKTR
jgi:23S rRNA pseudouridine2605 synthase